MDGDRFVLETPDGEYRCRAAVFAIGMTEPWIPTIPGLEVGHHYVHLSSPGGPLSRPARGHRRQAELRVRGRRGDLRQGLRELTLVSPRPPISVASRARRFDPGT